MSLLRKLFAPLAAPAVRDEAPPAQSTGPDRATKSIAAAKYGLIVDEASRLDAAGRYSESLGVVTRALLKAPASPELLFAKGRTLSAWGRQREALAAFLQAEASGLQTADFQMHLGWACLAVGASVEAERRMREAVAAKPEAWRAHFGLAKVLQAQGRTAEAIACFERALELNPDELETIVNLGVCRIAMADAVAGEAQFRRAIAIDDRHADAWNNLGVALEHQLRHAEARDAYERAASLEAQDFASGGSYVNLALSLQADGETRAALDLLERNLARRGSADAHGNYAQALRTAGRLPEGWTHFEFRWLREPLLSNRPALTKPVWTGQDLRGKTILLRAEQGLGDTLQFIRYAPHLKALGATVLLSAQSALREVLRGFPGVDRMLGATDSLPHIDYYVHLLSLPRVFGSGVDSIPSDVPYLQADPARSLRWSKRLQGTAKLNVGITWAGRIDHIKDRQRSMSLALLGPWGQVEGVRFHSLQKGPPADDAKSPPPGFELVDLAAELDDFADTAAAVENLDLVITVDTAVAHLAGAMGKPVWLMLPSPAEWRWMENRDDSPWYPTMRMFRQSQRGDWAGVVDQIKAALQARVGEAVGSTMKSASTIGQSATRRGPLLPAVRLPREAPGHQPGFSAVAETRYGILQFLPDEPFVGDSLGWYGEYLQPQLNLLLGMIGTGATLMEVAAGVGHHALPLSAAIGTEGYLLLYESRPVLKRALRQNLTANGAVNATLMQRTLGPGEVGEAETLDELQLEQLDWLKLNDGATALAILDGAAETLWRLRPRLFITAPDQPTLLALAERAKEFGYRCWRVETPLFNPDNFNGRADDIFADISALALLAIPEEACGETAFDGCVELR